MAYIAKHGEKWRAQVAKGGVRKTAVWNTKREATDWATRTEAAITVGKIKRGAFTYWQGVEKYIASISSMKKEGAAEWERRRFAYWADFFGEDTPLAEIDSNRIGEWRDWRLKGDETHKPVSAATVVREANLLRNFMLTAKREWKEVEHHAFEGVRLPAEDNERELIWGWRDIRRVLRHCQQGGDKTRLMGIAFHIALRTSLRLKEVFHAKLDGRVIVLADTKTTKKGKPVRVPTIHQGRRVMQRYAKVKFNLTPNEGSTLFHNACVDIGLRVPNDDGLTFHDSRATALTHMSKKMPVQVLQKISRHRDINVLINRYYRETAEQIAARL